MFSCIHSCILITCVCPFPAQETLTGEEGQSDSSQVGLHWLVCYRRCATSLPGGTHCAQEIIAHSSFVAGRLAVTSCGAGERLRPLLGEIIASAWSRPQRQGAAGSPFKTPLSLFAIVPSAKITFQRFLPCPLNNGAPLELISEGANLNSLHTVVVCSRLSDFMPLVSPYYYKLLFFIFIFFLSLSVFHLAKCIFLFCQFMSHL